ncbi:MAG: glycoside hydrolase family 65 protein [Clostridia bacterium]|nr:glycoside hydrolase family 65 protein [Clostridia bacterium]
MQYTIDAFDPARCAKDESLFALGNGFIGWRGNYEEGYAGDIGVEGCYVNGFHETGDIHYGEIAYGYAKESQTMLNVTSSQRVLLEVDGVCLHPDGAYTASFRRTLDLDQGILFRQTAYRLPGGTVTVDTERFVSQAQAHLAAIRVRVSADFPCTLALTPLLDGRVSNLAGKDDPRVGGGVHGQVLGAPRRGKDGTAIGLAQHTKRSGLAVACAMAARIDQPAAVTDAVDRFQAGRRYEVRLTPGMIVTVDKIVSYVTGEKSRERKCLEEALQWAGRADYEALRREQIEYMAAFWHDSGITIDGDERLYQGLRFNMFQLLQSVGRDGKTNIAAKGLTGEGYEGHYFWDTETYIFPMFLHVKPEIAKALLTFRYHMLPLARARAREMGHPIGALFPWRTINGHEASAYYPAGTAQVHINADIALAVNRYWQSTEDDAFLYDMGAEILCETARLYYDLGFFDERRGGAFCIHEVTGPDEYSALVNNNAYTNFMAAENLRSAVRALKRMEEKTPDKYAALKEKIDLRPEEGENWQRAADRMYIPRDEQSPLIWQDDGFMHRVPWPLDTIPRQNFPLLLHYHPLVIYRHQVCKQADTVLAMLLLPHLFTREEMTAVFDYYDRVTTHDSSLSKAAFSAVASRIGRTEKAYAYFHETARTDLDDTHGNTRDGLHMANMAGTWVCMVFGFGGMQVREDTVAFDPVLPREMQGYGFRVNVKNRIIEVHMDQKGPRYRLISGAPITICASGQPVRLG